MQAVQQSNSPNGGNMPRASINYILFDDQFRVVRCWASMVKGAGTYYQHYYDSKMQNIEVTKNGYLYVYCSNESPINIQFDNLQVVHTRGPLLEETHYYPFGLTMAGISSKAANKQENLIKFNTWERNSELELSVDESFYRINDYQIGKWWQPDPKIEANMENWTPYSSNLNNPILYNDPKGDCPMCIPIIWAIGETVATFVVAHYGAKIFSEGVAPAIAQAIESSPSSTTTTTVTNTPGSTIVIGSPLMMGTSPSITVNNSKSTSKNTSDTKGGTYVLKDSDGNVDRSGRTKDLKRREKEHARDSATKDKQFEVDQRTDDYKEQRGLEQRLHDIFNPPSNKIKPIRDNNPKKTDYMDAAKNFLNKLGIKI